MSLVLVTVLAACGKHNSQSSGNGKYASSQVLNLSYPSSLDSIDISNMSGYGSTGNIFESLYRLGKNGSITPGLAKSTKVSKDGKTYTFTIRNAKWSDGSKITAQDFVYSWKRTVTPATKSQYAYLFSGVKNADEIVAGKKSPSTLGVKAQGEHTFIVTLDKPITYFKKLMTYPLFGPISEKAVKKWGNKYATKAQYMLYSGPFKLTGWTGTNNSWQFVKNNQYWDKKAVHLQKINYTVNESTTTTLNLFQEKKLDLTQLASEQVKNMKSSSDYTTYPYSITAFLVYNFQDSNATIKKALNNAKIRQAISLSINRKTLVKNVIGDASTVSKTFVPQDLVKDAKTGKDFTDESTVKNSTSYNKTLAQKLWKQGLKETGIKKLSIQLLASNDEPNKPISQYLKSALEKNLDGLTVNLSNIPSKVASSRAQSGDFDLYLSGWGADFNDPISHLQIMTNNSGYNYGKYNSSTYNALVNKAQNQDANDTSARWQDMINAEKTIMKDQGITPLYQTVYSYLQNPKVKGIIHNTAGTQWNYKYAYIAK
ncbi:peptide ABC transporter substrate-binding protein [Lactiplantibacillus plantarum]|uniref:Oligopeptide ABC transporter periplasmicoligopeptide-binding protein OppA n=2 Tax=Lactiplantibacillus plantarum TaxID=1590 RepID=A0A165RFG4_LACPN|nr:peptide ABC transporter substrate-binding protein [Lactiplantibacillus plantarum]ASX23089.1 peptide ABC transporter substrate-binding protein [Lactiplantibacillus plantarum]KKX46342.1 peptide ABC transporter substrate-binding protein [Lactiplantibacillus plantarum]KZD98391.1 Oligopeptide ABC transporter periplasmic oligopeptide-binding protein OppA [Lactiplantibacillus plantarum]KZU26106.1 Oligopeptide ABC transporter periplasmicoligopeptide-binding protein OppA [Lactiplantibacillus plantaru